MGYLEGIESTAALGVNVLQYK